MALPIIGMLQDATTVGNNHGLAMMGKGLGAGLALLGTGLGIGRIGGQMTESMARQPELAGTVQTAAIVLAALIEGAALFALVITLLIK
jgi:F-type H+-transporting ATPase subunit c